MCIAAATSLPFPPLAALTAEPGNSSLYPLILMVLLGCWAILFGGAVMVVRPVIRREFLPAGKTLPVHLVLAGILVLGIIVRLMLSPLEPMLSTYSGLGHVADAYKIAAFDWSATFQSAYPLTVQALAGMVMAIVGRSPEVFFYVVGAISMLTIPALFVLGRILWGEPRVGLVAALFAALFPPFILFSTSGSLALPYAALGTTSMALLLLWLRTGSTALLVTLLAALLLTLQCRLEAAVFIVPVLATPFLYSQRLPWKQLLGGRTISIALAFGVLALPYLSTALTEVNSELTGGGSQGFAGMATWVGWSGLVIAIFYLWGQHHQQRQLGTLMWGSLCLGAAYLITWQLLDNSWGLSSCFPGSEYLYTIPGADSFAPVGLMYIEPLLVPAGLTLAYFAAYAALNAGPARRRWLLLHLWFIPLVGVTFIKSTGELPFCGARTALAAAPPFLLLAAAGLTETVAWLGGLVLSARLRMVAAVALTVAVAATFVAPSIAISSGPFNQQQEYQFVKGWISTLPEGSLVAYNNGPIIFNGGETCSPGGEGSAPTPTNRIGQLYRTNGLLTALLADNELEIMPHALDTPESLGEVPGEHPLYYYEGLDCWRTGKPEMMPLCKAIRSRYKLAEIASHEFENKLYGSDFLEALRIDLKRVRITLYKVLPRPDGKCNFNSECPGGSCSSGKCKF